MIHLSKDHDFPGPLAIMSGHSSTYSLYSSAQWDVSRSVLVGLPGTRLFSWQRGTNSTDLDCSPFIFPPPCLCETWLPCLEEQKPSWDPEEKSQILRMTEWEDRRSLAPWLTNSRNAQDCLFSNFLWCKKTSDMIGPLLFAFSITMAESNI